MRASWTTVPLGRRVVERTARALRGGALLSIPTEFRYLSDRGVEFFVRIAASLGRKDEARKAQERLARAARQDVNPFLPHDPDLWVADLSPTHLCLLNKYNVLAHHLLLVTRAFAHQEELLDLEDFEALWRCLAELGGLAFYNAGEIAGASQPHKHLQWVPLPMAPQGPAFPLEPLLAGAPSDGSVGTAPELPFVHAVASTVGHAELEVAEAARRTLRQYRAMLTAVGLWPAQGSGKQRTEPYNLLVTQKWMWLVPRAREHFEGISLNALGFAGALLVRSEAQLGALDARGPMTALERVAGRAR